MGLNISKKKKIIEVSNFYEKLENFECCICFNDRKCKLKKILCRHQICEKCFYKIKDKNLCPICRQTLEELEYKDKKLICYIDDPYQENFDINKKEIIEQINLYSIQEEDVLLIQKHIGKIAVIGKLNDESIMIYFMPFYINKKFEIIEKEYENKKFLLYTLIDDLIRDKYDIWYNNKLFHDEIKKMFKSIYI